jgi:MFS family permease
MISLIGALLVTLGSFTSMYVNNMKMYIITIGILSSIGNACVNAAIYAILPHYFDKNLGLATGIMNSGSSIITTISPFLAAYLLKQYSLRVFFQMSGFIFLLLFPFSLFYKPLLPKVRYETTKEKLKESFQIDILKNPKFICWIVSTAIWEYGSVMFYQTIVSSFN